MNWPVVHRIAHLIGGLNGVNAPQQKIITIYPFFKERTLEVPLPAYERFILALQSKNLKVYGVDFIENRLQADNLYPPTWRPFYREEAANSWLLTSLNKALSELRHAGHLKKDVYFIHLCQKIGFQFDACSLELQRLSYAYTNELNALCVQNAYKSGQKFETLNSNFIYIALHAFLSAIGVLRDYLAEYLAAYPLKEVLPPSGNFRTMSGLLKALKKLELSHPIVNELLQITDAKHEDGWLAKVSAYRDLVIHYSPIESVAHRGFLFQKSVEVDGYELPGIFFPMPEDPFLLKELHSKREQYKNMEDWVEKSLQAKLDKKTQDGLEYAHSILGKMALLTRKFVAYSPYKPKPLVFTQRDIIGPLVRKKI